VTVDDLRVDAWYTKGIDLDHLGEYTEAIACYDKALHVDTNNIDA
jgi:tetratricopeptide (TPR) repeat protein